MGAVHCYKSRRTHLLSRLVYYSPQQCMKLQPAKAQSSYFITLCKQNMEYHGALSLET